MLLPGCATVQVFMTARRVVAWVPQMLYRWSIAGILD